MRQLRAALALLLLVAAHPALAAIATFDVGKAAGTIANLGNLSVTVPAGGIPAGALVVIIAKTIWLTGGGCLDGVNYDPFDSVGNTYHAGSCGGSGGTFNVAMAYAYNVSAIAAGQTISIHNISGSSRALGMTVFYATGVKTTADPRDSTVYATVQSTANPFSLQAGAAPAVAGTLLVGGFALNNTCTFSTTGSFTEPPPTPENSTVSPLLVAAGATDVTSTQDTFTKTCATNAGGWLVIDGYAPAASSSTVIPGLTIPTPPFGAGG